MTFESAIKPEAERLLHLVKTGALTEVQLQEAVAGAACRGVAVEKILRHEYRVPRRKILEALSEYYQCPWVEYDERIPIPPELLLPLSAESICDDRWFPVIKDGETVIIATADPRAPDLRTRVQACIPAEKYEFYVALPEDIQAIAHDFLNSHPSHLVGNERTGLALWRNTMARWRTKLACYRTDFAKVRTNLGFLRGGLGLIAIERALMHLYPTSSLYNLYWIMTGIGFCLIIMGLYHYIRIKKGVLSPPPLHTVMEVTTAVLYFIENFQYVEDKDRETPLKKTMLARLARSLLNYSIAIDRSYDNKDRSYLAHQRNLLSAQRTIAGCYRTVFAQARTGLSFIRTGVAFLAIGIGLIQYFGYSLLTGFDLILVVVSIWMIVDGALWYLPAWKEQSEVPDFIMRSY